MGALIMARFSQDNYKQVAVDELVGYENNARTHSDTQVAQIVASIKEFGFTNPVLIDPENGVIAGHGRLMAAKQMGLAQVPCLVLHDLSEAQKRAYVIADNKLALNAGWDEELLKIEFEEIKELGFDLSLTGFGSLEIESAFNPEEKAELYSRKIASPHYQPTGEKPKLSELIDRTETEKLLKEIDAAEIPEDEKQFLRLAAERHTVFNFKNIAEYYSHSEDAVCKEFENSALVIVDSDLAIERGFLKLVDAIAENYDKDHTEEASEDE